MSGLMEEHLQASHFADYQMMREELVGVLTDADLGFRPAPPNASLGALCREMGDVERSYIEAFRTFRQDFSYRNDDPRMETSVDALRDWYVRLDEELAEALSALSDEDVERRRIVRSDFDPSEWSPLPPEQLDEYKEALLIFYGKASVYLKAMGKPLPGHWREWIA